MFGPDIIVRSLTVPTRQDRSGNRWQYHSRSDHHSKVGCWAILFDLLRSCPLLANHAAQRKVTFGINHTLVDFRNNRKKDLDLVVCTPAQGGRAANRNFAGLGEHYQIELSPDEQAVLEGLPPLDESPVASTLIALEAKACMTAHQRALPRLYDELNSSHLTTHGATDEAIASGFVMVNAASQFLSPDLNKRNFDEISPEYSRHSQPRDAGLVVSKISEMPRRSRTGETGFDAIGIVVIECRNDGTPVKLVTDPPAPQPGQIFHYATLVERLSHLYSTRFGHL